MQKIIATTLIVIYCTFGVPAASAEDVVLSADALHTAVIGKTLSGKLANGKVLDMTIRADGTMFADIGSKRVEGTWEFKPDGSWCRTISGKHKCQTVESDGSRVSFINKNGSLSSTFSLK